MFHPLLVPNFMHNFGKILRAVSEIIRSGRMDKGDFIWPVGFQPGTK